MSILDGFPSSKAEGTWTATAASLAVDQMIRSRPTSERQRSILALLKEGLSFADIFKISKEERDAVLLLACRHLQAGDPASAKPLLTQLVLMEPLDERAIYALATAHQVMGDPVVAGKLYLNAMALDATNPEGYLRLGECLLANREIEAARGLFEGAKALAAAGHGTAAQIAHADRMLAALPPPDAASA